MKKPKRLGKTKTEAAVEADQDELAWYFVRLAFLAVPWRKRTSPNASGMLFKQVHLVRARSIASAFAKADYILSLSEHRDGRANLRGVRVDYRKVGVLEVEPLYEELVSGVELFDESELNIRMDDIHSQVISPSRRKRLVEYERLHGKPPLLKVFLGDKFNEL